MGRGTPKGIVGHGGEASTSEAPGSERKRKGKSEDVGVAGRREVQAVLGSPRQKSITSMWKGDKRRREG